MATSGSDNFIQTRNEIIEDAYALIGVYGSGRTISAEDQAHAVRVLNKMVKAWQAQGIHIWAREQGYLFLTKATAEYTLGAAGTRAALKSDTVLTTLGAAAAAAATSLTVGTTTGMTVADNIGVVLDDGTVHWDTIATIPTSTTLTITSGLASAASNAANVYTYTTAITKPLRIPSMRRVQGIATSTVSDTTIPMTAVSNQEYFELPSKTTNAEPIQYYYEPDRTTGTLYLWPRPSNVSTYLEFTFERALEDFDASTDNPDFPAEWLEAITYQLAYRLAPAFGADKALLLPEAMLFLEQMKSWDTEDVPITFNPTRGPNVR